jgi:hypothetical protein
MSDERAVPSMRDLQGASWAALAAGPLAWFADQQISYRLTIWVCNGGPSIVLHLVNLLALVVAACGIVIALRRWPKFAGASGESDRPASHAHFLVLLGLMLSAFFLLPIVAQTIATFILDPCQK